MVSHLKTSLTFLRLLTLFHSIVVNQPRYITIRRGALISLAIALCICPWHFASSNSNFSTYLSAYSVLLAPFIGILLSDYYIVRRVYLNVPELYSMDKEGSYWYTKGVIFRAFVAYIGGLLINIVGFAGAVGASGSSAATHIYILAPFTGSLVGMLVYVGLCWYCPPVSSVSLREKGWLEAKGGYEAEDWDNPTQGKVHDVESNEAKIGLELTNEKSDQDSTHKQELSSIDY